MPRKNKCFVCNKPIDEATRNESIQYFHISQDAVARYISEQQGKDVFDYSIFGDARGQSKIGDFTQSKLEVN